MTTSSGRDHVLSELRKHPSALAEAYEAAHEAVERAVGAGPALRWAEEGVRIAQQGPRAWEAAAEYFRASPDIVQVVGLSQLERWVESGIELAQDSPVVASAYFRASPEVLPTIAPRHIAGWAALGRGLSRGTWKSSKGTTPGHSRMNSKTTN